MIKSNIKKRILKHMFAIKKHLPKICVLNCIDQKQYFIKFYIYTSFYIRLFYTR